LPAAIKIARPGRVPIQTPVACPAHAQFRHMRSLKNSDREIGCRRRRRAILTCLKARRPAGFEPLTTLWDDRNQTMLPDIRDSFAEVFTATDVADHIGVG
jgi:hypothetical protein